MISQNQIPGLISKYKPMKTKQLILTLVLIHGCTIAVMATEPGTPATPESAVQGATASATTGSKLNNPFFPFLYGKLDGGAEKLKELGFTPYEMVKEHVDFKHTPAFALPEWWVKQQTKTGRPGLISVCFIYGESKGAVDEAVTVKLLQDAADKLKGSGVEMAIYPHVNTYIETAEQALALARKVDRNNVGVTLNLFHELKVGNCRRLPEVLANVKDHLKYVVINGTNQPKDPDVPCYPAILPLGEGTFDMVGFLKEVKKIGYDGPIGQMCWGLKDPSIDYLTKSAAAWKEYKAKVEKE